MAKVVFNNKFKKQLRKLGVYRQAKRETRKGYKNDYLVYYAKDLLGCFIWRESRKGHRFWSNIDRMITSNQGGTV